MIGPRVVNQSIHRSNHNQSTHTHTHTYTHTQSVFLTEKEVDELVKEWKPEPLTPPPDVRASLP